MIQKTNGKYKGWNVCSLENPLIKLHIAPNLGGRIIQLNMNDSEFFFVNRIGAFNFFANGLLEGKEPDSTRLDENGTWLNFGGEKYGRLHRAGIQLTNGLVLQILFSTVACIRYLMAIVILEIIA